MVIFLSYVVNTRVVINNEQVKGVEVSPESKEVPVGNGVEDGISVGSAQEDEQLEENMVWNVPEEFSSFTGFNDLLIVVCNVCIVIEWIVGLGRLFLIYWQYQVII